MLPCSLLPTCTYSGTIHVRWHPLNREWIDPLETAPRTLEANDPQIPSVPPPPVGIGLLLAALNPTPCPYPKPTCTYSGPPCAFCCSKLSATSSRMCLGLASSAALSSSPYSTLQVTRQHSTRTGQGQHSKMHCNESALQYVGTEIAYPEGNSSRLRLESKWHHATKLCVVDKS
jgi:hypothetical protein